jgi:hypothetical protein
MGMRLQDVYYTFANTRIQKRLLSL